MKVSLKNVGKVKEADIEINAITVIAGENNTGKSTVGKVLFSIFNSFYEVDAQINKEKIQSIIRAMDNGSFDPPARSSFRDFSAFIAEQIIKYYEGYKDDVSGLFFKAIEVCNEKFEQDFNFESISNELLVRLREILAVKETEIFYKIVNDRFNDEFAMQVNNIYTTANAEISINIKDVSVSISFKDDEIINISDSMELRTESIYIDDPFVIDEIRPFPLSLRFRTMYDHRNHLKNKLMSGKNELNIINEIITTHKFDEIFDKVGMASNATEFYPRKHAIQLQKSAEQRPLMLKNLSTGLKTFLLIKTLLTNGSIQQNGTIILDEPEIHLHPEWQLLFAELIVLIQKEFGMHILLNTHSPYFLNAIEVFSAIHGISQKCKYYLAENINAYESVIFDTTNNIEAIYSKLARPLQDLENKRYNND